MADVCTAIAHGSLMGARGNSGVILSQILRGLAETFTPLESIDTRVLMVGLRRGADAAYEAVMRPVEGTILTAARSVAEAVEEAVDEGNVSLEGVLERAAGAARAAVEQSPHLLPVLAAAGVVDAGSRGFELLLHACLHVVAGRPLPEPDSVRVPDVVAAHQAGADDPGLRYEVMYLLHADDATGCRSSGGRGAPSATRSSSWGATASGTVTSTPTRSVPRSRRASPQDGPSGSG